MNETKLQKLYWHSQTIHDQLFSLEHRMRKLSFQGKQCLKTQEKYFQLMDDLREINSEMLLYDETQMRQVNDTYEFIWALE